VVMVENRMSLTTCPWPKVRRSLAIERHVDLQHFTIPYGHPELLITIGRVKRLMNQKIKSNT
jgi:hypothetical protein